MHKPLTYPERKPVLAFVMTWFGLSVPLLLAKYAIEQQWGIVLGDYATEAMIVLPAIVAVGVALFVFVHQAPPEPGSMDDPDGW